MKKVNPRRKPASMADIERAKKYAENRAIATVEAVFLTVLVDKFDFHDRVVEFWKETDKLSAEIVEGYVSLHDLIHVLNEEYGIGIYDGEKGKV